MHSKEMYKYMAMYLFTHTPLLPTFSTAQQATLTLPKKSLLPQKDHKGTNPTLHEPLKETSAREKKGTCTYLTQCCQC